jgi:hypothetical protein
VLLLLLTSLETTALLILSQESGVCHSHFGVLPFNCQSSSPSTSSLHLATCECFHRLTPRSSYSFVIIQGLAVLDGKWVERELKLLKWLISIIGKLSVHKLIDLLLMFFGLSNKFQALDNSITLLYFFDQQ